MAKNLIICDLLDIYGPLLSEKKRRILELYYYDDLSLSEISENEGGSRQAALDMIKRASDQLLKMEATLSVLASQKQRGKIINQLKSALDKGDIKESKRLVSALEDNV